MLTKFPFRYYTLYNLVAALDTGKALLKSNILPSLLPLAELGHLGHEKCTRKIAFPSFSYLAEVANPMLEV